MLRYTKSIGKAKEEAGLPPIRFTKKPPAGHAGEKKHGAPGKARRAGFSGVEEE